MAGVGWEVVGEGCSVAGKGWDVGWEAVGEGCRHQNLVDSLFSYRVIDKKQFLSNGVLNLHIVRNPLL